MRSLIAAGLLAVSALTAATGFGMQTIWAPPTEFTQSIDLPQSASYAAVSNKVLKSHPGRPLVEVTGSGRVYLGYGRDSDVFAWLGESTYLLVGSRQGELSVSTNFGTSLNSANPAGSDLWRDESGGKVTTKLQVNPAGDAVLLVASDGRAAVPEKIKFTWQNQIDWFWSQTLLVSAAGFAFAGLLLLIIDRRIRRLKNGPKRRYRKPPKPPKIKMKRRPPIAPIKGRRALRRKWFTLAVLGPVILSGCSLPSNTADPSASPSASESLLEAKPAVITRAQLGKILQKVSDAVRLADSEQDKKLLAKRVAGAALTMRSAHYLLQSKSREVPPLPAIAASPISFSLPAATDSWPRSVFAVTTSNIENGVPQLLVLTQETPRQQYKLTYYVNLIPGVDIPEVAAAEVGAIQVDPKSLFLKLPPLDLVTAYGDVLNRGPASLSAGLFDLAEDAFFKQISASQKEQVASLPNASFKFEHKLLERKRVTALSTSGSGALVALYMEDTYTIKPRNGNSAVAVSGDEKLLLGADGSTRGVRTKYGNMMFFYVPSLSSDDGIKLLGASQGLLSVKSL